MIRYYGGVEGSGKSCMMTRDLYRHSLFGGRVLTFPGYEIYGRTRNQVISEPIFPEQLLELITGERDTVDLIRNQRIAVGVDEVSNFFDHHTWYNKINDILKAILQQRRKLQVAFLMTGPIYEELPPDIRRMIHEVIHCCDGHTLKRDIPRGQTCIYYKEDKRGLLSHPNYRFTRKMKFRMIPWRNHYDTYAAISPLNQFVKVRFQNREVLVGVDGKPIESNSDVDFSSLDGMIKKYQPVEDPKVDEVRKVLIYLQSKGKTFVENSLLREIFNVSQLGGRNGIGSILQSFGAIPNRNKEWYDISGIVVS